MVKLRHIFASMSGTEDRPLINAAQAGDQEAIVRLLERYRDSVYRFGMRMCSTTADAEDVVQETLLTAAQKLDTFRGEASFSSWLYAIARSGCSRRFRITRKETGEIDTETVVDQSPQPEQAVDRQRVQIVLERGIASLEPVYREVLLLRDVEGLTAPEVADSLGVSVAAVKSRLHRARNMLRERVEGLLSTDPAVRPAARCPDVVPMLSREIEHELTPARCADFETRLARCADPGGQFDALRELLGECRACQGPQVPENLRESIELAIRRSAKSKA